MTVGIARAGSQSVEIKKKKALELDKNMNKYFLINQAKHNLQDPISFQNPNSSQNPFSLLRNPVVEYTPNLCDIANCVATSAIMVMISYGLIKNKYELMRLFKLDRYKYVYKGKGLKNLQDYQKLEEIVQKGQRLIATLGDGTKKNLVERKAIYKFDNFENIKENYMQLYLVDSGIPPIDFYPHINTRTKQKKYLQCISGCSYRETHLTVSKRFAYKPNKKDTEVVSGYFFLHKSMSQHDRKALPHNWCYIGRARDNGWAEHQKNDLKRVFDHLTSIQMGTSFGGKSLQKLMRVSIGDHNVTIYYNPHCDNPFKIMKLDPLSKEPELFCKGRTKDELFKSFLKETKIIMYLWEPGLPTICKC